MFRKEYQHFLSLSYASENKELVNRFAEEFRSIFEDAMFFDKDKEYIFASAESFKQALEDIFTKSQYVVVFYSKEYPNKQFPLTELRAVKARTATEGKDFWFNVKIGDFEIKDSIIAEGHYHPCHEKCSTEMIRIIVDKIKKNIMTREINDIKLKSDDACAALNLQTLFMQDNPAKWRREYDWNIIARKYIQADGRKLADEYPWTVLWKYVYENYSFFRDQAKCVCEERINWRIRLNCHLSIAFALGCAYGELHQNESNRRVKLISSYLEKEYSFLGAEPELPRELTVSSGGEMNEGDLLCVVEASGRKADPKIMEMIKKVLPKDIDSYPRLHIKLENKIETSGEFWGIAKHISEKIQAHRTPGTVVQLFLNAPAILAFVLAGYRKCMGTVQLYDFLQEGKYVKTLNTEQIAVCE